MVTDFPSTVATGSRGERVREMSLIVARSIRNLDDLDCLAVYVSGLPLEDIFALGAALDDLRLPTKVYGRIASNCPILIVCPGGVASTSSGDLWTDLAHMTLFAAFFVAQSLDPRFLLEDMHPVWTVMASYGHICVEAEDVSGLDELGLIAAQTNESAQVCISDASKNFVAFQKVQKPRERELVAQGETDGISGRVLALPAKLSLSSHFVSEAVFMDHDTAIGPVEGHIWDRDDTELLTAGVVFHHEARCVELHDVLVNEKSGVVIDAKANIAFESGHWGSWGYEEPRGWLNNEDTQWVSYRDGPLPTPVAEVQSGFVAISNFWHSYYHWFNDVMPLLWVHELALDAGLVDPSVPVFVPSVKAGGFQDQALSQFAMRNRSFHQLKPGFTRFKKLYLPEVAARVVKPKEKKQYMQWMCQPPAFYRWLRNVAVSGTAVSGDASECVFVGRSDTNLRTIVNEAELRAAFEARGYKILYPGLTLAEQVSTMQGAKVVVGPHGAGLSNFMFAPPGATLLEIRNSEQPVECFWLMAAAIGAGYQVHTSRTVVHKHHAPIINQDMYVDIPALMLRVESLLAAARAKSA